MQLVHPSRVRAKLSPPINLARQFTHLIQRCGIHCQITFCFGGGGGGGCGGCGAGAGAGAGGAGGAGGGGSGGAAGKKKKQKQKTEGSRGNKS